MFAAPKISRFNVLANICTLLESKFSLKLEVFLKNDPSLVELIG